MFQRCGLTKLADDDDVLSLGAFLALGDGEFHLLTLFQVTEAFAADGAEVDEDVRATLTGDETEALGAIEPLHGALNAFCHCDLLTPFLQS